MEKINDVFEFKQSVSIVKSTGEKAETLRRLCDLIGTINPDSIYHHTYQYFQKDLIREYTNDFAHWVGESLEEHALSERLSNIDPYTYGNIEDLRSALAAVIEDHLEKFPEPRPALPGDEFFFTQTVTLTYPASMRARNLAELFIAIKYVDSRSIYYHFFEARRRLAEPVDDFSAWIKCVLNKEELAERVSSIDPFMHTIEGIRDHITTAIEKELRRDMESSGVKP